MDRDVTYRDAIELRYRDEEWLVDVTVDLSRVPKDLRVLAEEAIKRAVYRSVKIQEPALVGEDGAPTMSWAPIIMALLLGGGSLLVTALVVALIRS